MKKLWLSLFAFVLSVCCSFAIVRGSYTRANYIAHSNAYCTDFNINDSDVSPYWEQTDYNVTNYQYAVGLNGVAYTFALVEPDEYDTLESLTLYTIINGVTTTSSVSSMDEIYGVMYDNAYGGCLNLISSFVYNNLIYCYVQDYGWYTFDGVDFSTTNYSDQDALFCFDNHLIVYSSGYYYIDGVIMPNTIADIEYDYADAFETCFYADGKFYTYAYNLTDDSETWLSYDFNGNLVDLDYFSSDYYYIWSDGKYAYYDNGSTHMIFDTANNEWVSHSWTGYTGSFSRQNVWSDGNNIYMTYGGTTYMLHVEHPYVSPYPNVLSELIAIMTGGIAGIAEGIGANLSVLAESVMIDVNSGNLSAFGSLVVIMAGLALALHLCRWVVSFVTSLGKRNR